MFQIHTQIIVSFTEFNYHKLIFVRNVFVENFDFFGYYQNKSKMTQKYPNFSKFYIFHAIFVHFQEISRVTMFTENSTKKTSYTKRFFKTNLQFFCWNIRGLESSKSSAAIELAIKSAIYEAASIVSC